MKSIVNYNKKELIVLVFTYGTFTFMHENINNIYHLICSIITIVFFLIHLCRLTLETFVQHPYPQYTQTFYYTPKRRFPFAHRKDFVFITIFRKGDLW